MDGARAGVYALDEVIANGHEQFAPRVVHLEEDVGRGVVDGGDGAERARVAVGKREAHQVVEREVFLVHVLAVGHGEVERVPGQLARLLLRVDAFELEQGGGVVFAGAPIASSIADTTPPGKNFLGISTSFRLSEESFSPFATLCAALTTFTVSVLFF